MSAYYPGKHLLLEFYGAKHLDDINSVKNALTAAVDNSNATLLNINLHDFGENKGITGVALLAESHISIHTWPEFEYAAIDIFMCGQNYPENCIPALKAHLKPTKVDEKLVLRGESVHPKILNNFYKKVIA